MVENNINREEILAAIRPPIARSWMLGIVGAILASVFGWYVFGWLISQGYYALALPGGLVGLGFSGLARRRLLLGGIFSAVVAALLMLACEWHFRPFIKDDSLPFFLSHLHELTPVTWLMLILGVVVSFWFGLGNVSKNWS